MNLIKKDALVPPPLAQRRVPRIEPTLEDDMAREVNAVAAEIKAYAPSVHPDRVSHTTRIMTQAIQKVAELRAKVEDIAKGSETFKQALHAAATALNKQIEVAMAMHEDLSRKLQESPFGAMPAVVTKPAEVKPEPTESPRQSE